ncbi:hypothetical protein [Stenotrophobium rhamnosiphilum]|uniref:Uncharacterized protein n=1 Tax=Stenotrophobium rhamnosiphilum TaxID=2029166 RepID=A0A2T5MH05_9GAMM|nr:hypothetical protein [Stenotrophobium rhamnosiphilum]PTU31865.1 hypothetical protein CJD38_04045 [Stenotrophobium rhamnosiphilum]
MKNRMAVPHERALPQAMAYLFYYLIFVALAFLSQERWITTLSIVFSVITLIRAIRLFAKVMFNHGEYIDEELTHRIELPRNY